MTQLGALFSERDFEKVEFEIEDALKGIGRKRQAIEEQSPVANVAVAAPKLEIPTFLLDRNDRPLATQQDEGRSYVAFTSPSHLAWIVPLVALLIGHFSRDHLSAFGFFLAPYAPWLVSACIGCLLRDNFLDGFRKTAAIMQLSAAGFVGTVAFNSWSIGNTELLIFATTAIVCLGEIVASLFIGNGVKDRPAPKRQGPKAVRFDRDLPPILF
jgi:hypothetical protein